MADSKKRFVLVGAHTGNVVNGLGPMARLFRQMGRSVTVILQKGQSAAQSYLEKGKVWDDLLGIDCWVDDQFDNGILAKSNMPDCVVCALSPVVGDNIELQALNAALNEGLCVFGVSDFPNSWRNPGWRDYPRMFTTLFSPMPEPTAPCKCVVTGWGALEKWRGVDVQKMGHEARSILGIGSDPVLYVSFSPERESPLALEHLALVLMRRNICGISIVVNRHGRERTAPIDGNGARYYDALSLLSKTNHVIDQSPEFGDLPSSDDNYIPIRFRPRQFLSYQQAVALTAGNGLMLSFFGTDALIAPFLASQGVLSALWLDPVFGGAVLKREKQVEHFDPPAIWQPTDDDALIRCLRTGLENNFARIKQCVLLTQHYPFPEKPASQIIVDEILRQVV